MEKEIMSKTNDTSKLDRAKIENRVLVDTELDGVTGGIPGLGTMYTQAIGNGATQAVGELVKNAGYPSGK
jgi:hypothetical protein